MRIRDSFLNKEPTFETRMLYAMYTNKYDDNAEEACGYLDAAKELLESNKTIEDIEYYINIFEEISKNVPIDEYEKGYRQAYRDFIKQEKLKEATNE